MKKILLMFMMCFSFVMANAQIATENSKILDNTYVGVEAGVTTPFNFNSMFPLNTVTGIKVGKELTPVFGIEAEGQVFFNDNNVGRWTNTFVKGTNIGLNGTMNFNNLFAGYKGTPRFFEIKANAGLGWLHYLNAGSNDLLAKTALDFNFNFGKSKQHTLMLSPGIYWNLTGSDAKMQFNKNYAQLSVFASYVYHFKTSNGTHHFKTYDVGAMIDEINRLNEELSKKPTTVVKEVIRTVETPVTIETIGDTYIFFAKNSSELSNESKELLNKVKGSVNIIASASPEGTKEYNQQLSEKRAEEVAKYLTSKGVKVITYKGIGCVNETSNRVAIIKIIAD